MDQRHHRPGRLAIRAHTTLGRHRVAASEGMSPLAVLPDLVCLSAPVDARRQPGRRAGLHGDPGPGRGPACDPAVPVVLFVSEHDRTQMKHHRYRRIRQAGRPPSPGSPCRQRGVQAPASIDRPDQDKRRSGAPRARHPVREPTTMTTRVLLSTNARRPEAMVPGQPGPS